ncbi:MAG: acetyl-CoA carboxylase biotin carboxylase subunit [Myxococcota bacterium]
MKIRKILVANRGEIAVRVMRTCRDLGIDSVAVYSEPDRKALHVRYATEAFFIGPASAAQSYLNIEKIIAVAKQSGADAIHPGYGFLSENAHFAAAVEEAGFIFIGPKAHSIESMGSKTRARQIMQAAGVPVVPGLTEAITDPTSAMAAAVEIGFPVMLKAAAGGGGRGMRLVSKPEDFLSCLESAQSESQNAFGDSAMYIEKFLEKPRHIEVQIFADSHGRVFSFPERECSVQRRHQKVIEESPSTFVTPPMREKMGEVARQAARAVDYLGAGTIEFLVDAHRNFYFMEMNTRLQVEHPITEMVTDLDLVEMQILVAQGEPLPFEQSDLDPTGWAIEARVCAEDPNQNFIPSPGLIKSYKQPGGPYVRTDMAIYGGYEVAVDYDSMIGKIITWAPTRDVALRRLDRALSELIIQGCVTNTTFLRQILNFHPFHSGDYDTSIIDRLWAETSDWVQDSDRIAALLGAALFYQEHECSLQTNVQLNHEKPDALSAWQQTLGLGL